MTQSVREIDWRRDSTDTVIRKIRAGEGHPGVLGRDRRARLLPVRCPSRTDSQGPPGRTDRPAKWRCLPRHGRRGGVDHASAAVRHRRLGGISSCPPPRALELAGVEPGVPEIEVSLDARLAVDETYREIAYEEHAGVGYLRFDFYNGAMSTEQCRRLRDAYAYARTQRQTNVIVLLGGDDYFSNGIHLSLIEAADGSGRGVLAQPGRDRRPRARHRADRLAHGDLSARWRRGSRRRAAGAGRRLRRGTRGHRPEPVLPAHGRPLRIGVLDLPAASPHRCHDDDAAHSGARSTRSGHSRPSRSGCWTPRLAPT